MRPHIDKLHQKFHLIAQKNNLNCTGAAGCNSPKMSKTKSKYNTNFCVYGCNSKMGSDLSKLIHFHRFPEYKSAKVIITNKFGMEELVDRRFAWDKFLLMGKPSAKHMRVCSKHFKPNDYLPGKFTISINYNNFTLMFYRKGCEVS